jgi:hypothetical protein
MDFVPYHNVSSRMRIGVFPKQEYKKRPIWGVHTGIYKNLCDSFKRGKKDHT